jgi:glycerol 3-phosphatase-2
VTAPLIDRYDAALFDLDGVVYLGPTAVPGAASGVAQLRERGVRVGFVTNNAARSPQAVVDHLTALDIVAATSDVVTSAQAGARLLADLVDPGALVLVVGTEALANEVAAVGLEPTWSVDRLPAAVIQGYHPELPWKLIDRAAYAIQQGALWIGTNTDSTRPTDRGLVPGAGAQIGALRNAVTVEPVIAGKPYSPLLRETVRRLKATRPIFVGDRIDTDIDGAAGVGMDSLLVFTGAHGKRDLIAATSRPTHIGWDLGALLEPVQVVEVHGGTARCGGVEVGWLDGRFEVAEPPHDRTTQLCALRALLALVEPGIDPALPEVASLLAGLRLIP